MRKFNFGVFGLTLIVFNTILYFLFRNEKGVSTEPQLLLILVGVICCVEHLISLNSKG